MTHFEEVGITQDNPFDRICVFALEYARAKMFSCMRFKNDEYAGNLRQDENSENVWLSKINEEYDKLLKLDADEIEQLRKTSNVSKKFDVFSNSLNLDILEMEKFFDTAWGYTYPSHNDEFDALIHGTDSEFMRKKKHLEETYSSMDKDFNWDNFVDIIDFDEGKICSLHDLSHQDLVDEYHGVMKQFGLSHDDVNVLWHMHREERR